MTVCWEFSLFPTGERGRFLVFCPTTNKRTTHDRRDAALGAAVIGGGAEPEACHPQRSPARDGCAALLQHSRQRLERSADFAKRWRYVSRQSHRDGCVGGTGRQARLRARRRLALLCAIQGT